MKIRVNPRKIVSIGEISRQSTKKIHKFGEIRVNRRKKSINLEKISQIRKNSSKSVKIRLNLTKNPSIRRNSRKSLKNDLNCVKFAAPFYFCQKTICGNL